MPDTNGHKPMRFDCQHCRELIGYRVGDTLRTEGFAIDFLKTHAVKCRRCGHETKFWVANGWRNGVKRG